MDILLFGIQGSGKGTQGKLLAEKYGLTVFEMGGELRKMIQSGTSLGNQIKTIVESGQLVSAEVIMEVVESFLSHHPVDRPILFDGIPRTFDQARSLETLLRRHGRSYHGILIHISQDEAIQRLTKRRICSACKAVYPADYPKDVCETCGAALVTRADDNTASIQKRLENYNKETIPLVEHYRSQGLLTEINGAQPIPAVTQELFHKTESLFFF
ncbi:nucleoside monophosphate kinase [Candidatus Peregrinibacteria bacterium]|nr:nucleoside monophosphate kinase [Candidatus Peregrinibacteria bacterium]